jgi:hypothetical protein
MGPFWTKRGQKWVKNVLFPKVVLDPLGCANGFFLAHFEPVVTGFGPWKVPKCLGNGPLCDQKGVKSGSQTRFPKYDLGPFAMLKQVVLARWAPFRHRLADGTSQIAWKMGRFGTKRGKKWV